MGKTGGAMAGSCAPGLILGRWARARAPALRSDANVTDLSEGDKRGESPHVFQVPTFTVVASRRAGLRGVRPHGGRYPRATERRRSALRSANPRGMFRT